MLNISILDSYLCTTTVQGRFITANVIKMILNKKTVRVVTDPKTMSILDISFQDEQLKDIQLSKSEKEERIQKANRDREGIDWFFQSILVSGGTLSCRVPSCLLPPDKSGK